MSGAVSVLKVRRSHLFRPGLVVEVFGSGPAGAGAGPCGPVSSRNVNVRSRDEPPLTLGLAAPPGPRPVGIDHPETAFAPQPQVPDNRG